MSSKHFLLLKLTVISVFLGRAYQHIFWDVPYRTFLWNEKHVAPIIKSLFGLEWNEYANSLEVDGKIQFAIKSVGIFLLVLAILVAILNKSNFKYLKVPIFIGGLIQILLALVFTKEAFFQLGQFFEYSLQFVPPFLLLYAYSSRFNLNHFYLIFKFTIGLTFFCHGLYALGFYPVPGNFIDMTISILSVDENTARLFLQIAGVLDFLILIFIFIKPLEFYTLFYAALWGFLTALARIVAHYDVDFMGQIMHQYTFETIVRLCNFLGPILAIQLYFLFNKNKKELHLMPQLK